MYNLFDIQKTGHCQSFLLPMQQQSVKLMMYFYESAYNNNTINITRVGNRNQ